ncbi:hypothetical protein MNBD_GAMMA13-11 [hydrothermal vent metagenome]|uniref:Uncharacterized protein n=1 Tax=hydrothermal vent metagenome TaxID=652676 RepID=A0A3B0Y9I1_9ZZZZ
MYHSHARVPEKDLEKAGFDMETLSIVDKGCHTEEGTIGYTIQMLTSGLTRLLPGLEAVKINPTS